jgi:hypothetical protein
MEYALLACCNYSRASLEELTGISFTSSKNDGYWEKS